MKTGPWPQWGRASPAEQKAFILKQGEGGTLVAEICRKAGISQATYYSWKIEASRRHWFERDAEGMAVCCLTRCGG